MWLLVRPSPFSLESLCVLHLRAVHFLFPTTIGPGSDRPTLTQASTTGQVTEVAIAIGASACFAGCRNDGLGFDVLYSGVFNPQSTDNAGDEYQNITVTAPNYFDGEMLLSVAHFYLQGVSFSLSSYRIFWS